MHMQGTPRTMQRTAAYDDVVDEVLAYLRAAPRRADGRRNRRGADRPGPGIGFGKTTEHNLQPAGPGLAAARAGLPGAGGPLAKAVLSAEALPRGRDRAVAADRTAGTIGVALALARQGVQVLRVHDVAAGRQALLLFEAAGGLGLDMSALIVITPGQVAECRRL